MYSMQDIQDWDIAVAESRIEGVNIDKFFWIQYVSVDFENCGRKFRTLTEFAIIWQQSIWGVIWHTNVHAMLLTFYCKKYTWEQTW